MAFEVPKEKNAGKIIQVTLGATPESGGTRSHTITIGGCNAWPFHFFKGEHPHRPRVAMEVIVGCQEASDLPSFIKNIDLT